MERENKYLVLKNADIAKHLSDADKFDLVEILETINEGRLQDKKPELECVVVESDWPEYETVWGLIEKRVDASPAFPEDKPENEDPKLNPGRPVKPHRSGGGFPLDPYL